jgi:hypothetical protein
MIQSTNHVPFLDCVRETMQPAHVSLLLRPDTAPQPEDAV